MIKHAVSCCHDHGIQGIHVSLTDVVQIQAASKAFAAIKADGTAAWS